MSKKQDTSQAEKAVFDYLHRQNRPYSVVDIGNNLHNEVGKTAIQKVLEQLTAAGRVREKVYGKQKVYVVNQELFPPVDPGAVREMDEKIGTLTRHIAELQKEIKQQDLELVKWSSSLGTEEASSLLRQTESEVAQLRADLEVELAGVAALRLKPVTSEEREKVVGERRRLVGEWRKRKRLTTEIVNAILEGYPKSKKALLEEVGIETDEDVKVSVPEC